MGRTASQRLLSTLPSVRCVPRIPDLHVLKEHPRMRGNRIALRPAICHRWNSSPRPQPTTFRKLVSLGLVNIALSKLAILGSSWGQGFRFHWLICSCARVDMHAQGRDMQRGQTTQEAIIYLGDVLTSQSKQVSTCSLMKYHREVSSEAQTF